VIGSGQGDFLQDFVGLFAIAQPRHEHRPQPRLVVSERFGRIASEVSSMHCQHCHRLSIPSSETIRAAWDHPPKVAAGGVLLQMVD
jgi:hypothetical protein